MARRKLPKNIGDFVHLRYLSLTGYAIKSLPSSIEKLCNLPTLELTFMGTLPNEICNFGRLRHLYAYYYDIGGHPLLLNLKHLQTLCLSAGSWIENYLGKLTNLRKLGICGDLRPHQHDSIDKQYSLRSLKLVGENSVPQYMSLRYSLSFHHLRTRHHCYLSRLKILRLLAGSYCSKTMICSPGGFRRLEFLALDCSNLKEWIAEEVSMPSLKSV